MRFLVRCGKVLWVAGIAVLLIISSSCAQTQTPETSTVPVPNPQYEISPPVTMTLTARDSTLDRNVIEVPAGIRLTIVFINADRVPHNFALYRTSEAKEAIFVGDAVSGNDTATYNFVTPDTASRLFFRCDIHPEMSGTFIILG